MAQKNSSSVPWNGSCESYNVYTPEKRPGFVAWVTAFPYGDGSYGLCFDETVEEDDPDFVPPKLEFGEAVGAPVSYGSVECGDPHRRSYRVYLRTRDGKTFTETGRCPRREGSFCAAGFPDGRILGFDVPKYLSLIHIYGRSGIGGTCARSRQWPLVTVLCIHAQILVHLHAGAAGAAVHAGV